MRKTGLGIFLLVLALGGCGSLAEKETFPEEERKLSSWGQNFTKRQQQKTRRIHWKTSAVW